MDEAKHIFFKLLAVFVDALSCLFSHYGVLILKMQLSSHLLSDRDVNLFCHSRQLT